MDRIGFVFVGTASPAEYVPLQAEYINRINRIMRCKVTEIKPVTDRNPEVSVKKESGTILAKTKGTYRVLLDERGRSITTEQLRVLLEDTVFHAGKPVCFIIGGPNGVTTETREQSDMVIRLSSMTFPYMLARIILLEQIYRALTLIRKIPYSR